MLGEGNHEAGVKIQKKYSNLNNVDKEFSRLADYWDSKLEKQQIITPNEGMNTFINIWNLYQA